MLFYFFLQLDKFVSIRILGSKKERSLFFNLKIAFVSNDCFLEMMENILKLLLENQFLEFFEKMMVGILIFYKMFDVKVLVLVRVDGILNIFGIYVLQGDF